MKAQQVKEVDFENSSGTHRSEIDLSLQPLMTPSRKSNMEVKASTKLAVAFRSGNVCAKCQRSLTVDYADGGVRATGECAHIAGEHEGAARYNPSMTDQDRNSFPNLIYLCSDCHAEIDKIPEGEQNFSIAYLQQLKSNHENTIRQAIINAFPDVGFQELSEATQWTMAVLPTAPTSKYSLVNVSNKMQRNDISPDNLLVMKTGLSIAPEIKHYIVIVSKTDPQFPERLRDGFLARYHQFRQNGYRGDELFEAMCQLSQKGFPTQRAKSAGLAVLIYMFEACEVFEK